MATICTKVPIKFQSLPSVVRKGFMHSLVATESAAYCISQHRQVVFRRLVGGDTSWHDAKDVARMVTEVGGDLNLKIYSLCIVSTPAAVQQLKVLCVEDGHMFILTFAIQPYTGNLRYIGYIKVMSFPHNSSLKMYVDPKLADTLYVEFVDKKFRITINLKTGEQRYDAFHVLDNEKDGVTVGPHTHFLRQNAAKEYFHIAEHVGSSIFCVQLV